MGRRTTGTLSDRRAINQLMLHAGKIPPGLRLSPGRYVRALRAYLRMSQADLAGLSGINQKNIAGVEAERAGVRLETIRRLLDAMSCGLLVLPLPRGRLGDVVGDRESAKWGPGERWTGPDLIPLSAYARPTLSRGF